MVCDVDDVNDVSYIGYFIRYKMCKNTHKDTHTPSGPKFQVTVYPLANNGSAAIRRADLEENEEGGGRVRFLLTLALGE
jgi:hypothetical protein